MEINCHKDIGNCNIPQNSNSVLEVIPKSINKFPLRQSSKHLSTIVDHHELTVISPSNHVTISRILNDSINKLKTDGFISNPFNINVTSTYSSSTSKLNVRDFILRWIQSIPIQVAGIDAGVFLPLQDGHDSSQWLQMEQVNGVTAQQIAEQLRFGVFELLFSAYSHLPVSVIVCAGGQSSGKSTFLNHMFNHFFDVSGGRTTQGVWFGVRVIAGRMWIAIDLEGLDSFERTTQRQSYQALFGAALAQYFVLRTTHHFDRFTQNCLNSWADAALGLAEGDELFKGTLLMTPRDVSDDAIEEVIESFSTDFESFWTSSLRFKNGEHRHVLSIFPTTEFIPWPSYGSFPKYSEAIGQILKDCDKPRFQSFSDFRQIASLLLVKFYIQDFSSSPLFSKQINSTSSHPPSQIDNSFSYNSAIVKIQAHIKGFLCRKYTQNIMNSIVHLQSCVRIKMAKDLVKSMKTAITTIQDHVRVFLKRRRLQKINGSSSRVKPHQTVQTFILPEVHQNSLQAICILQQSIRLKLALRQVNSVKRGAKALKKLSSQSASVRRNAIEELNSLCQQSSLRFCKNFVLPLYNDIVPLTVLFNVIQSSNRSPVDIDFKKSAVNFIKLLANHALLLPKICSLGAIEVLVELVVDHWNASDELVKYSLDILLLTVDCFDCHPYWQVADIPLKRLDRRNSLLARRKKLCHVIKKGSVPNSIVKEQFEDLVKRLNRFKTPSSIDFDQNLL
ncbi:hypothetical protein GEMRC1_008390 [Eukaryota sp. GEM-RC1]